MEVDTVAALSLISEYTYSFKFSSFQLHCTDIQLRTYNGELLSVIESFDVNVKYETTYPGYRTCRKVCGLTFVDFKYHNRNLNYVCVTFVCMLTHRPRTYM